MAHIRLHMPYIRLCALISKWSQEEWLVILLHWYFPWALPLTVCYQNCPPIHSSAVFIACCLTQSSRRAAQEAWLSTKVASWGVPLHQHVSHTWLFDLLVLGIISSGQYTPLHPRSGERFIKPWSSSSRCAVAVWCPSRAALKRHSTAGGVLCVSYYT